jgi:hypothetical protein
VLSGLCAASAALLVGCVADGPCTETATCPPPVGTGSDAGSGIDGRDGSGDQFNRNDSSGPASDVSPEIKPDGIAPTDRTTSNEAQVDSSRDGTAPERDGIAPDSYERDSSEPDRADNRVDANSADAGGTDATIDDHFDVGAPTSDGGSNPIDVIGIPDSNQPPDASPGDVHSSDTSDAISTSDVVTGCNASTCSTGCCNATSQCVSAPSTAACGSGGATCQTCGSGQECNGTSCVCTPASCPNGCCDSMQRCVPLAAQNNATCGAGGTQCTSCGADQTCNGAGSCIVKTWCETQTIPSGVATADYRCLDFETGTLPTNSWVLTQAGGPILEVVTDQVKSAPYALHIFQSLNNEMEEGRAQLVWSAVGGFVSSVVLDADIFHRDTEGGGGDGKPDYMCVSIGALKACLTYRYSLSAKFSITVPSGASGPIGTGIPNWDVTGAIASQTWTHVQLQMSNGGNITFVVDGASQTFSTGVTVNSGATAVQLGGRLSVPGLDWGNVTLDNVAAFVRR